MPYFEIGHTGGITARQDKKGNIVFSTERIFLDISVSDKRDGSSYLALECCPNCTLRKYCNTIGINKNIEVAIPISELAYNMESACEVVNESTILMAATVLALNK